MVLLKNTFFHSFCRSDFSIKYLKSYFSCLIHFDSLGFRIKSIIYLFNLITLLSRGVTVKKTDGSVHASVLMSLFGTA